MNRLPGTFIQWQPRWRLSQWVVLVEEWLHRPLDGIASTTGRYFEASPLVWMWICALRLLLASRYESMRVFAAHRWRRIEVTYWYPEGTNVPDFRAQPQIGGFAPAKRARGSTQQPVPGTAPGSDQTMITCMHKFCGGQNVREELCGKRATHVVPKIIEQCAGHDVELQVCGVHRRFWKARGFDVTPLKAKP